MLYSNRHSANHQHSESLHIITGIPRLSKTGSEHLATDLNYIINVFTALGVAGHPHPLLGYVAQLCQLNDESLRSQIEHRRGDEVSEAVECIKRMELRIAYVRGVSV